MASCWDGHWCRYRFQSRPCLYLAITEQQSESTPLHDPGDTQNQSAQPLVYRNVIDPAMPQHRRNLPRRVKRQRQHLQGHRIGQCPGGTFRQDCNHIGLRKRGSRCEERGPERDTPSQFVAG